MDKKNSWYIDDKGKTLLYLGEVEHGEVLKISTSKFSEELEYDKRYLYLDKKILLKYFSEDEIDKIHIKELLNILFENCGEYFMYSPKKPRKTVSFLGERTSKIEEGFVYEFNTGFSYQVFKFL